MWGVFRGFHDLNSGYIWMAFCFALVLAECVFVVHKLCVTSSLNLTFARVTVAISWSTT